MNIINEVSSHKEMLCTFCLYPGTHTAAAISLATYGIGAAVSFSVTIQVATSLLEQAINTYVLQPVIHCTVYTTSLWKTTMVSSCF